MCVKWRSDIVADVLPHWSRHVIMTDVTTRGACVLVWSMCSSLDNSLSRAFLQDAKSNGCFSFLWISSLSPFTVHFIVMMSLVSCCLSLCAVYRLFKIAASKSGREWRALLSPQTWILGVISLHLARLQIWLLITSVDNFKCFCDLSLSPLFWLGELPTVATLGCRSMYRRHTHLRHTWRLYRITVQS